MRLDSMQTLARRALLAPLDEVSRTETVIYRLRSAITLGVLGDGERLPSEVDLAKQFNVSPVTLRDALRALRAEGLVQTTRGRQGGSFVSEAKDGSLRYLEEMLLELNPVEIRDLTDWQCAVTSRSGELASERASGHGKQVLSMLAKEISAQTTSRNFRRLTSRFIIELAANSQSTRLIKAAIRLQVEFAPLLTLAYRNELIQNAAKQEVAQLFEAVAAGDAGQAHSSALRLDTTVGNELLTLRRNLEIEKVRRSGIE